MFPWGAMDHSVVMAPPSYPYPMAMTMPMPMPMQMPPRPMPMHPHMQPYQYFGNQNPGVIPNPCSTYLPYITPNTLVEQQSTQYVSPVVHPGSQSQVSGKQDAITKSTGESQAHKSEDSIDVTTELELKTPGSTSDQVSCSLLMLSCFVKDTKLYNHFNAITMDLVGFILHFWERQSSFT